MQKNKISNMIIINNAESNIIKDAIIYLKDDININRITDKTKTKEFKIDIIAESESLIKFYDRINDQKFNEFQKRKLLKKMKKLKIIIVILIILLIYFIKI